MNNTPTLKIKRMTPGARVPTYGSDGAACFDLYADIPESVTLYDIVNVGTGLAVEVPPGYVMLVYSRSGHGFHYGVRLSNCVGVIDSDYRGEVRVQLTTDWHDLDLPARPLTIKPGDRIAQAMVVPAQRWALVDVDELSVTARGEGGFGSTGA